MNEGTPSIIDILAPGTTGLSEEKWAEAVEYFAYLIHREAECRTLLTLRTHLSIATPGIPQKCFEEAPPPVARWLGRQGIFFTTENRYDGDDFSHWYTWGICREDKPLLLVRGEYRRLDPCALSIAALEPKPQNILEMIRERDGGRVTYFALCRKLAAVMDEFVQSRTRALYKSVATQAQARTFLHELSRLEKQ